MCKSSSIYTQFSYRLYSNITARGFVSKMNLSTRFKFPLIFQNEKAFQRQPTIFLNHKKGAGGKKKSLRYHKEVGLGFKTPREVHITILLIQYLFLQTEKAFQKQPTVFLNQKLGKKKKTARLSRNVGLGFKTPREVCCKICFKFTG